MLDLRGAGTERTKGRGRTKIAVAAAATSSLWQQDKLQDIMCAP